MQPVAKVTGRAFDILWLHRSRSPPPMALHPGGMNSWSVETYEAKDERSFTTFIAMQRLEITLV